MTDRPQTLQSVPQVRLHRIKGIDTYEVLDMDLDALDAAVSEESRALGFLTFSAGALVSLVTTWLSSPPSKTVAVALLVSLTVVSALASAWFGLAYREARRRRPAVVARMRDRAKAG